MATTAIGMRPTTSTSLFGTEQVLKRNAEKQSPILLTKNRVIKLHCSASFASSSSSSSVMDPYKTLKIERGASESDVKKAFRHFALKYHPDVCKGSNCGVQFQLINEAYNIVMSELRGESKTSDIHESYVDVDDGPFRGMDDSDSELWEEWMGWEGANGTYDYSSHINPYI